MNTNGCPWVVDVHVHALRPQGYETFADWIAVPRHVYIGRKNRFIRGTHTSAFANPFPVKTYGRAEALCKYEAWLRSWDADTLRARLAELTGCALGCWCAPQPCHGDVLVKVWREQFQDTCPPSSSPSSSNVVWIYLDRWYQHHAWTRVRHALEYWAAVVSGSESADVDAQTFVHALPWPTCLYTARTVGDFRALSTPTYAAFRGRLRVMLYDTPLGDSWNWTCGSDDVSDLDEDDFPTFSFEHDRDVFLAADASLTREAFDALCPQDIDTTRFAHVAITVK